MTNDLLFSPITSMIIISAMFFLMIWPGYALLHLLGHRQSGWSAALFAGPAVTLAIWTISLSGAAWASIPLSQVSRPIWIATFLLAGLGLVLRASLNFQSEAPRELNLRSQCLLWLAAILVPVIIMPAILRYGLGIFVNSTYPDAWSYVMVADYLSAVARGADIGLSPLHQYASHLMYSRNASSAILAHLAIGLGGIKADQVMTLFCMLLLFANTSALISFGRTAFGRTEPALCLTLLAGLGWPANIVIAGNFDQLLLLPMLPLTAALALRAGTGANIGYSSILIGMLAAAAFYAYVELAFLGLILAISFLIPPAAGFRLAAGRVLQVCSIAVPIFIILTWPGLSSLMAMLKTQYLMAVGTVRPGEGFFPGLMSLRLLPDALWALGGEFFDGRSIGLLWIVGAVVGAVTLLGVWVERWRWSVVLASAIVAASFIHFAYRNHYSYGAYKIVSISFWMISFFSLAGGLWLIELANRRSLSRRYTTAVVAASLFSIGLDRTFVQADVVQFKHNAFQQTAYREAMKIASIVQHAPTLLAVRDDVANEWSVFYLSDMPLLIAPYRRYMSQAHVIPHMERAKFVEPSMIRYIVTDRNDAIRAPVSGAHRIWDGQSYSLWSVDGSAWAVLADVKNPKGSEPDGIWLDGTKAELLIVTGQEGPATLTTHVQPGPGSATGTTLFRIVLEDATGVHNIGVRVGLSRLPVDLAAGKSVISLTADGLVSPNTDRDPRSRILRLTDYSIERSGDPAR